MTESLDLSRRSILKFLSGAPLLHHRRHGANGSGGTILAGGYYDINNKPIIDDRAGSRQFFSDSPGRHLAADRWPNADRPRRQGQYRVRRGAVRIHHWAQDGKGDSMYGKLPSPIAVLTLDQDKAPAS
jgi:hypothetical protein